MLITLTAKRAPYRPPGPLKGLEVCQWEHLISDSGETIHYKTSRWPELFSPRLYPGRPHGSGIIVPIHGQNYRVVLALQCSRAGGYDGVIGYFFPVSEPETPFTPYDEVGEARKKVAALESEINRLHDGAYRSNGQFRTLGWREVLSQIHHKQMALDDLTSGRVLPRPHGVDQWGGQPGFNQEPVFPSHDGVSASCLATLETGWGDGGNVVVMLSCDEQGIPVALWWEASCS